MGKGGEIFGLKVIERPDLPADEAWFVNPGKVQVLPVPEANLTLIELIEKIKRDIASAYCSPLD